ncbi:MAG: cobalamin biosynthesis protein CobD, partial [Acidobacteria bacterium]|nr:cobalamin biosynthesis protein CobD [Acidobacteriota bacterium]
AAAAGALRRRLVGPIWLSGEQVTDLWIGDPLDPPLESGRDVGRALFLAVCAGALVGAAGVCVLAGA